MIEDWQVAMLMAKAKEADLLADAHKIKVEKKNHTYPLHYSIMERFGRRLISFGVSIEEKFKTSDYDLQVVRAKA